MSLRRLKTTITRLMAGLIAGLIIVLTTQEQSLSQEPTTAKSPEPLFRSSITSTDFDFITEEDPSAFRSISFLSKDRQEMPDKRSDEAELFQLAYVFAVDFTDGTSAKLYVDGDFEDQQAALVEAQRYVHPLGKLPTALRKGVQRVVIHQGGRDTTAFSDNGLIVLYSENATLRISTHDLEETVFHESVHATWDAKHAKSKDWKRAQQADRSFLTVYAERNASREDLAESAIFAFALMHHPDRIPDPIKVQVRKQIPNRMAYISRLLPIDKPLTYSVDSDEDRAVEPDNSPNDSLADGKNDEANQAENDNDK